MERVILLLSLTPVFRGFIAMLLSGACFPLCGVMIMRLNLIPMRYMLMHGVILGGAISIALSLPLVPMTILVNLFLVILLMKLAKNAQTGFGGASAATMVISMAIASVIMHVADIPAKDTLGILWGSPFALTNSDLVVLFVLLIFLLLYVVLNFRNISALFFNQDIACSMGINIKFHYTVMILIIAVTVALAMQLLGAFLIDSLLILPVVTASTFIITLKKQGLKHIYIYSSIFGFIFSVIGYVLALYLNWPPSGTIALAAGTACLLGKIKNLLFNIKRKKIVK